MSTNAIAASLDGILAKSKIKKKEWKPMSKGAARAICEHGVNDMAVMKVTKVVLGMLEKRGIEPELRTEIGMRLANDGPVQVVRAGDWVKNIVANYTSRFNQSYTNKKKKLLTLGLVYEPTTEDIVSEVLRTDNDTHKASQQETREQDRQKTTNTNGDLREWLNCKKKTGKKREHDREEEYARAQPKRLKPNIWDINMGTQVALPWPGTQSQPEEISQEDTQPLEQETESSSRSPKNTLQGQRFGSTGRQLQFPQDTDEKGERGQRGLQTPECRSIGPREEDAGERSESPQENDLAQTLRSMMVGASTKADKALQLVEELRIPNRALQDKIDNLEKEIDKARSKGKKLWEEMDKSKKQLTDDIAETKKKAKKNGSAIKDNGIQIKTITQRIEQLGTGKNDDQEREKVRQGARAIEATEGTSIKKESQSEHIDPLESMELRYNQHPDGTEPTIDKLANLLVDAGVSDAATFKTIYSKPHGAPVGNELPLKSIRDRKPKILWWWKKDRLTLQGVPDADQHSIIRAIKRQFGKIALTASQGDDTISDKKENRQRTTDRRNDNWTKEEWGEWNTWTKAETRENNREERHWGLKQENEPGSSSTESSETSDSDTDNEAPIRYDTEGGDRQRDTGTHHTPHTRGKRHNKNKEREAQLITWDRQAQARNTVVNNNATHSRHTHKYQEASKMKTQISNLLKKYSWLLIVQRVEVGKIQYGERYV